MRHTMVACWPRPPPWRSVPRLPYDVIPVKLDDPVGELPRGQGVGWCAVGRRFLDAQVENGREQRELIGGRKAALVENPQHPLGERNGVLVAGHQRELQ